MHPVPMSVAPFIHISKLIAEICNVQALAAASRSVDCLKVVHSFHAYFILVGDLHSKHV